MTQNTTTLDTRSAEPVTVTVSIGDEKFFQVTPNDWDRAVLMGQPDEQLRTARALHRALQFLLGDIGS